MRLLSILTLAVAVTASPALEKRCSPLYDKDLARGYYPPAPCWQSFDTACRPYLAQGTEQTIDAKHRVTIVYGVPEYCAAEIAEELAREADGRKNYGWTRKHGYLTYIKGGILVISNMTDDALARYSQLTYYSKGR